MSHGHDETETFETFLQEAAQAVAHSYGLTILPDALAGLARLSRRDPSEAERLTTSPGDIEQNVARLIRYIALDDPDFDTRSGVITFQHLNNARAAFCREHPLAYPICPYPP
jgi:hypothetical protein